MSDPLKPLVLYHGNCQDGFTAAWACWLAHPDWEFFPATHGNPPPDVTGRHVYMLDFSFKRPVLLELASKANSIVILDHHASAQKDLDGLFDDSENNISGVFDMVHSGAWLAWRHFHPQSPVPNLIRIVEDRDLWLFKLAFTRAVSAALFSYIYDFQIWNDLSDRCEITAGIKSLSDEGAAIERKHHKDIAELVAVLKQRLTIGGVEVWTANLPYTLASDAGHLMGENEPFAATWYGGPAGRTFSLRSRPGGTDVSEIAKLYGGGGHRHAAGFRLASGVSLDLNEK